MNKPISKILMIASLVAGLCAPVGAEVLGDIVFSREGGSGGFPTAYFPHWVHRIQFKCYVCHDAIFTMKRGANEITMAAMAEGKACGTCHNGGIAWRIGADTCNRCHVGE